MGKTLCWSFLTYVIGVPDVTHYYPYGNAPLMCDISTYLKTCIDNNNEKNLLIWNTEIVKDKYYALTRLFSICPKVVLFSIFPDYVEKLSIIIRKYKLQPKEPLEIGGTPKVWYAIAVTSVLGIN